MNNLLKLSSLHALRSLRRTQTATATLQSLTTGSSILLRNHSSPSLGGVRHFGGRGNSDSQTHKIAPPINWGIRIVPEDMAFVNERLGKYHTTQLSGIRFSIPFVDRIAYVHSLREEVFYLRDQFVVTLDNYPIQAGGLIYLEIEDPYLASYGTENPFHAAIGFAQGTMHSAIGKFTLDDAFKERENLNDEITRAVNEKATSCGINCSRCVLKNLRLDGDPANGSTEGKEAVWPLEESQHANKLIDETVDEVKVSKKVTDEPGFSLQNRK